MTIEHQRRGRDDLIDMALIKAEVTGRNVWDFINPSVFSNGMPKRETPDDDLVRAVAAVNRAVTGFFEDAKWGTVREFRPFDDFDIQATRRSRKVF